MIKLEEIIGYFISDSSYEGIPELAAKLFCDCDSQEQARFFNAVCKISNGWENPPEFQWRYMEDELTKDAREMILSMYENTDGVE